jgi:hypothetical protein
VVKKTDSKCDWIIYILFILIADALPSLPFSSVCGRNKSAGKESGTSKTHSRLVKLKARAATLLSADLLQTQTTY